MYAYISCRIYWTTKPIIFFFFPSQEVCTAVTTVVDWKNDFSPQNNSEVSLRLKRP